MTPRERLLRTLRGELPDRVPVSPFVQEEYLAYYYPHKTSVDRVVDAAELAEDLDFDLIAKHRKFLQPHFLCRSYRNWELQEHVRRTDGLVHRRLEILTPHKTLVQEDVRPDVGAATAGVEATVGKHLLSEPEDIEVFFEFLPPLDRETIEQMERTAIQWRAVVGERGILAPWGWGGVFNVAASLRSIEAVLTAPYEDEIAYRAFMDRLTEAVCQYNLALAGTQIESIGIPGNMANGAVVGPRFFGSFIQPYEARLIGAIHEAGKFTIFHNCGCATALYPNYRQLGITVWETVAEAPQGDNRLVDAKNALGDRICLLGNLDQVHFLKTASPDEVAIKTRELVLAGKPGGKYIFSTSDFLEKNTPRENVVAMIEAAKAAGSYGRGSKSGRKPLTQGRRGVEVR